jgi:DNA recombination protein RmuC
MERTQQKNEVEKLQDKFTKEFENLANKILEESNKGTKQGKHEEHPVSFAGKDSFIRKKKSKIHKIDYHAALRQQILGLREMNVQMSKETINLTRALKGDSKMQGNGRISARKSLEKSGLEKDENMRYSKALHTEEGNRVFLTL